LKDIERVVVRHCTLDFGPERKFGLAKVRDDKEHSGASYRDRNLKKQLGKGTLLISTCGFLHHNGSVSRSNMAKLMMTHP